MSYEIKIDFCPVYELVNSLNAYLSKKEHKTIELGKKWASDVGESLSSELKNKLSEVSEGFAGGLEVLIYHAPKERSIPDFLKWLEKLTLEEVTSMLMSYSKEIPSNLTELKKEWVEVLTEWNEQYFNTLDPLILKGLQRDADEKKKLQGTMAAEELFERATNGMRQHPDPTIKKIVLVPQYHFSPMNRSIYYQNSDMFICFYACDAKPQEVGEPPIKLMRLTRCLADETRLKLLYSMSLKERTFSELVELSGLAKSTVHHHLIALRGAGLIRIETEKRNNLYTLREESISILDSQLKSYFHIQGE